MDIKTILTIVSSVLGALCTTIIPLVIKLACAIKKRKLAQAAQSAAEADKLKAEANADMLSFVNGLIEEVEALYAGYDKLCKANGGSAGPLKKDNVLTKLQAYALEKGYEFSAESWGKTIDDIVAMTRKVNNNVGK